MIESCPRPASFEEEPIITLAHGSGGKQTHRLLQQIFLPAFQNDYLNLLHDASLLHLPSSLIAFTTDSYVVQPLFFPGGDIGKLAITGTANDLAMCGAKPRFLSCSFIIEEGFLQADLKRIVASMKEAADAASIQIVTGDTKVIERQMGKNIFINTSGIGICMTSHPINPLQVQSGDLILLSGDIGRHGMAVMAKRENLKFSPPLESDCTSLVPFVETLLKEGIRIHCLRDLTRGGLATALIEIAESGEKNLFVEEEPISISNAVHSACEILGFDPLYVANEGRFIAFIPENQAAQALKILQAFPNGKAASIIGAVQAPSKIPSVTLRNAFGISRYLYRLVGDQLPRIC